MPDAGFGAAAREFLQLDLGDIDLVSGSVMLREGKGRKPRMVFFGSQTRKALCAYLRERHDNLHALWVTDDKTTRLSYGGLRPILRRRAEA